MRSGKNKAAKDNKKNNTALNAGGKKIDNTFDGGKSVPKTKKGSYEASGTKTFATKIKGSNKK